MRLYQEEIGGLWKTDKDFRNSDGAKIFSKGAVSLEMCGVGADTEHFLPMRTVPVRDGQSGPGSGPGPSGTGTETQNFFPPGPGSGSGSNFFC